MRSRRIHIKNAPEIKFFKNVAMFKFFLKMYENENSNRTNCNWGCQGESESKKYLNKNSKMATKMKVVRG